VPPVGRGASPGLADRKAPGSIWPGSAAGGSSVQSTKSKPCRPIHSISAMRPRAGFWIEMWVDAFEVHATGAIPIPGGLLGGPLASGLKQIVQQTSPKEQP
jgi:hypothetical protein